MVTADVVGMKMGVVNRPQPPCLSIQDFEDAFSGILIVAAVDKHDLVRGDLDHANLRWTLDD